MVNSKVSNPFDGVPEPVLLDLIEQAHSSGGTLPPALEQKLDELSKGVDDEEYQDLKSLTRILRQAHEGVSSD